MRQLLVYLLKLSLLLAYARKDLNELNCCSYLETYDPNVLVECVNSSMNLQVQKYIFEQTSSFGPVLTVGIVTRATPSVYSYASYSLLVQSIYSYYNQYTLLPLYPDSLSSDYIHYRKLVPLLEAMNSTAKFMDYIVWTDADIIMLDMNFRIEKIIVEHPKAHIVISADVSTIANSGCFIVRNSQWSFQFLKDWHQMHKSSTAINDQMGFEATYKKRGKEALTKIVILPPDVINSDAPPMGRQLPHHKILHLAAESELMRKTVFQAAAREVCSAYQENRPPAHQLGQTREQLQKTAIITYYQIAQEQLEKIVVVNNTLIISPHIIQRENDFHNLIEDITKLRYSVSKYCHAIAYTNHEKETEDTLFQRQQTYQLIYHLVHSYLTFANIQIKKTQLDVNNTNKWKLLRSIGLQELPEALKLSAESSHEYMSSLGVLQSVEARVQQRGIGEKIEEDLNILLEMVAMEQKGLVWDMKASLLSFLGELDLADNYFESSLKKLEASVTIYHNLKSLASSGDGDKRSELHTQSLYASALCVTGDLKKGSKLFDDVINMETAHVGKYHHNLISKYINAAICAYQSEQFEKSLSFLLNAKETLQRNPHLHKGSEQIIDHYLELCRIKLSMKKDNNLKGDHVNDL